MLYVIETKASILTLMVPVKLSIIILLTVFIIKIYKEVLMKNNVENTGCSDAGKRNISHKEVDG